jgi:hypothetical protein
MIRKVDNCLPKNLEDDIEKIVFEIPYYYNSNTSYAHDDPFFEHYNTLINNSCVIENGQFTHAILDEGHALSNLYNLLYPILYSFADKANIQVNTITRIKINLLLKDKTFTKENYNFPHSDRGSGEKIFIYYINDSDGDTIIFNEYDDYVNLPDKFTIADRITPKKGTGVFLESSRFHASSNPSLMQHRYVINFNFK